MLGFLTPYMMYIKLAVVALVLTAIAALYVQVERQKVVIVTLTMNNKVLSSVNAVESLTIDEMKAERARLDINCTKRLELCSRTSRSTQAIDQLTEVSHATSTIGNDVTNALNGMPAAGGGPEGIHPVPNTVTATGAGLRAGVVYHCIDEVNAKNLVKNQILMHGWCLDMKEIISSASQTAAK